MEINMKRYKVLVEKYKKTLQSFKKTLQSIFKNDTKFHPRKAEKRYKVFLKTFRTINVNLLTVKPPMREKVNIMKIPYEVLALDLIVRIEGVF